MNNARSRSRRIAALTAAIGLMACAQALVPASASAVMDDGSDECLYSVDCVAAADANDAGSGADSAGSDTSTGDDGSSDDGTSWDDGSSDSTDDSSSWGDDSSSWGDDSTAAGDDSSWDDGSSDSADDGSADADGADDAVADDDTDPYMGPDDTSVDFTLASIDNAPRPTYPVNPTTQPPSDPWGNAYMPETYDDPFNPPEQYGPWELPPGALDIESPPCGVQSLWMCEEFKHDHTHGVRAARKDDQSLDHWDFGKKKSRKGHSRVKATAKHATRQRAARGSRRLG